MPGVRGWGVILWHRWCTPLMLVVAAVWFATGWIGCAVQTSTFRTEVSSGQIRIARDSVPLTHDDTGIYRLGPVLTQEEQDQRLHRLYSTTPVVRDSPFVLSSKRERYSRWDWKVQDRSRHGAPFTLAALITLPPTRLDWNYAIWPLAVLLLIWKLCIISFRLGVRRGHLCQKCGYDRHGLAKGAACPECGATA
jgi:hypothetical protein